ncbi:hypothetical protein LCGC14_0478630 [marine sediment metagenome]|uniref:Uncharacterized protein n=1 Tax=marine sediment metagenome TaxID=412755 RepID=A0A0F9SFB9_9ZZZZ
MSKLDKHLDNHYCTKCYRVGTGCKRCICPFSVRPREPQHHLITCPYSNHSYRSLLTCSHCGETNSFAKTKVARILEKIDNDKQTASQN